MGGSKKAAIWGFAGVVVGVLIAGHFDKSINEDTLRVKYVEISAGILTTEPIGTPENRELRQWAVKNINQYAEIKLSSEIQKDLVENTPLPLSSDALAARRFFKKHFPEANFPEAQPTDGMDSK